MTEDASLEDALDQEQGLSEFQQQMRKTGVGDAAVQSRSKSVGNTDARLRRIRNQSDADDAMRDYRSEQLEREWEEGLARRAWEEEVAKREWAVENVRIQAEVARETARADAAAADSLLEELGEALLEGVVEMGVLDE